MNAVRWSPCVQTLPKSGTLRSMDRLRPSVLATGPEKLSGGDAGTDTPGGRLSPTGRPRTVRDAVNATPGGKHEDRTFKLSSGTTPGYGRYVNSLGEVRRGHYEVV